MDKYIHIYGAEDSAAEQIRKIADISEEDSYRILYYLMNHSDILGAGEFTAVEETKRLGRGIACFGGRVHINVKATTLVLCALLLDITFTRGVSAALLSLAGIPGQAVVKISEIEGEKCVVRELLRAENRMVQADLFAKFSGQCVNNDFSECKYKKGETCCCKSVHTEEILKKLENKHIVIKTPYGKYRYVF